MTSEILRLDGPGWAVREALGETWRWYAGAPVGPDPGGRLAPGWFPATVPGSVVTDLWRAGELSDPYRGRATRATEWTGARSWVYRRTVELPDTGAGAWATLEMDGVDPSGRVFWDGRPLGRVEGLYRAARFCVPSDAGGPGPHRLDVVLDPVPASQPQVGRTDLVRTHRPRMNEGWDFCPRFPHQGIWRSVRIVVGPVRLADLAVRAELDEQGTGRVALTALLETADEREVPVEALLVDAAGHAAATHRVTAGAGRLELALAVERPETWWPRGFGPQSTYTLEVRAAGAPEPVARRTVGFRRAELVPNPGSPASALPYTAVVNGQVVPLIGWNWVPADAQYGAVTADRVRHLVGLAAASGASVLRVWGGGLVETEEFYDACDRAGLLVWQEFSQSSSGMNSTPAADAEFVALMAEEAAAVVPVRAHHPSLLAWGGGNELDTGGVPLDERRSPVLAALRATVERLDPGRAWLPTSPSGPAFHHRLDVIEAAPDGQHDVHGPWEHQGLPGQHTLYDAGTSLAHTEFGVEGMTNRRALDRLVPTRDRWPADRTNPVYRHLGDWWNNAPLVRRSFGDRLTDLESLRRASQFLQATGLGYAVEAGRRRFPRCSAVLPWQLNESYPNAWCTSAVDHAGEPKPAYHAVARAFAPRRVTVRTPAPVLAGGPAPSAQAWLWARPQVGAGSQVVARLRSADGDVLAEAEWPVPDEVGDPRPAGTLTVDARDVPADAVVVWDLLWSGADGRTIDRESVLACTGADLTPLLDLPRARLGVTARRAGGGSVVEVAHRGGPLVVGLRLSDRRPAEAEGWVLADGDPRPLLPGESRTFTVRGSRSTAPPRLLLESWNTDPVRIDLPEEPSP